MIASRAENAMTFRVPTKTVVEPGCFDRLPEVARELTSGRGGGRALLVTDRGLAATPWPEVAEAALRGAGFDVLLEDGIETNPRHETIDAVAARAREAEVSLVVGLGGGSVLDAAKAAAILVPNGGSIVDYEGRDRFSRPSLPFVAIPTTCGTGSEVTWVSVVTHAERRAKLSVKGEGMFPAWALVDADLVATLPGRLVAWTGMDALTHALEAYVSRRANPVSDALAEKAVELCFAYLRRAAAAPAGDAEARQAMMLASTLAGMAFGSSDVGAVHCLSETLGGLYDVPHGLANAVLLGPVLRYSLEAAGPKLEGLAAARGPEGADRVVVEVEALVRDLSIPSFAALGVPRADFPEIARRAVANGSNPSHPRPMTEESYLEVLSSF